MTTNLIPIVDFIPEHPYSKFLKQPLKKGFFLPCDLEGNVLEEPTHYFSDAEEKEKSKMYKNSPAVIAYKEAKGRVLFEGFTACDRGNKDCVNNLSLHLSDSMLKGKTIEYLCQFNLNLTASAQKQINL